MLEAENKICRLNNYPIYLCHLHSQCQYLCLKRMTIVVLLGPHLGPPLSVDPPTPQAIDGTAAGKLLKDVKYLDENLACIRLQKFAILGSAVC